MSIRLKTLLISGLLLMTGPTLAQTSLPAIEARYVVMGENGAPIARVITHGARCPVIHVDGRAIAMNLRAPSETVAQRQTISTAELSKPSAFPVLTCEAPLPRGSEHARVGGVALPLPPREITRIVVIGDTGCRLKASENQFQACNDPKAYPFAQIARRAAAWKPDLVVHVGDYLYRETPCPADKAGCAGSVWGYGWDAWKADLFTPAAPLMKAAPWVVVRGNHEGCARGGQGWFRLMDPRPLQPGRDCNDARRDFDADYSAPYAVSLGGGAQVIVLDLQSAGEKPLAADAPRAAQYRQAYQAMETLSKGAAYTFVANHKPILGFGAEGEGADIKLRPGNQGAQSVFLSQNPDIFPATVQILLSGHVHIWEQVSFSTPHPTQFITGFSGTLEDVPPVADKLPAGATPAPGAVPDQFSVWPGQFGYMTLEKMAADRWSATVRDVSGAVVRRCEITGRQSVCH